MIPIVMRSPRGKRILVVAPHPDDDIFGAGGTLINAIEDGAKVDTLYVTKGSDDPDRADLIGREAKAACERLGATAHVLDFQPGRIPVDDKAANEEISRLFEEIRPNAVFITFLLDDHDDHRRVNHLLLNSIGRKRMKSEVWAYQIYSTVIPNVIVDITHCVEVKKELVKIFRNVKGNRDWLHYILALNAMNCRYIRRKDKVYAEAFFVVPLQEYFDLCRIYFNNPPEKIYYKTF